MRLALASITPPALAFAAAAATVPSVAEAADIATVLGLPDACGPAVPPSNDGIWPCIGFQSSCMHRVDLATVTPNLPNAVCSDGTPASFYVREGSGDDIDRWVIHLQGGAFCMDEAACDERWCGDGFYDAFMMSNDWDADGTIDRPLHGLIDGISLDLPGNDFATWTHVYVPYCTSDAWQGRESDVDFGGTSAFTVDARGHTVLKAVRKALRKRNFDPNWTSTDGAYTVPDLDDADEILFTGTSAGGFGALQSADWFLDPFSARTGLVVDAATDIGYDVGVNYDVWEATTLTNFLSHVLTSHADRWDPGGYWDEIDAFVDQTCRDHYTLDRCSTPYGLMVLASGGVPLIETPTFLRLDLEDGVLAAYLTDAPNMFGDTFEIGRASGVAPVLDDYTITMRETMVNLADDTETDISVFAPRCGVHVGLEHFTSFFLATTPDTDDVTGAGVGAATTFHDALLQWFDPGGAFTRPRWIDSDGTSSSSC